MAPITACSHRASVAFIYPLARSSRKCSDGIPRFPARFGCVLFWHKMLLCCGFIIVYSACLLCNASLPIWHDTVLRFICTKLYEYRKNYVHRRLFPPHVVRLCPNAGHLFWFSWLALSCWMVLQIYALHKLRWIVLSYILLVLWLISVSLEVMNLWVGCIPSSWSNNVCYLLMWCAWPGIIIAMCSLLLRPCNRCNSFDVHHMLLDLYLLDSDSTKYCSLVWFSSLHWISMWCWLALHWNYGVVFENNITVHSVY